MCGGGGGGEEMGVGEGQGEYMGEQRKKERRIVEGGER